jgi:tetratricopeptide (TPR) repeat protein
MTTPAPAPLPADDTAQGQVRFEQGRRAEAAGHLDEARRAYEAALTQEPDRAEWHYRLGCVLLKLNDPAAAEVCFERAAAGAAEPVRALTNLGVCHDRQGRPEAAARAYRRAIGHGGSAVAHHNLGAIHAEAGRAEEAIRCFEAALALAPDAEAHLNLGLVHYAREDFGRARECFDDSVTADPGFALGHYHAALCLMRTGMYRAACERFRRAARLAPRLARVPFHFGVCLRKLEEWEAARASLEQALEAYPEDGRIHYELALTCDALGLHQEARRHYGRARSLTESHD